MKMKLELRSISRRLSLAAAVLTLLTSPAFPQVKLSQINNGGNLASATDQLVGVRSGTTDELLTVGSACVENLTSIVIDNGAGGLTLGAGQVTNAMLGNASTTVNGQTCTLGASCTVAAAAGTLTGSTLASGVTGSSLTSLGTIGTGVWQGTLIAPGYGGTGVSNTATLTLGSSNHNYATLGTGIIKNTTTTGALSNAAASDVIGLFSGCSGTQYLGADGACHTGGGSGVSSFSGDSALLSNSASTGAVTATLANAAANTVWGNNTGSSAGPGYQTSIAISGTLYADTTSPSGQFQVGPTGTSGTIRQVINGESSFFGLYDSVNSIFYGISAALPAPSGTSTIGGYSHGLGIGGSSNNTGSPIFGVLTSTQAGFGPGNVAFSIDDQNGVNTYNNVLDDQRGDVALNATANGYPTPGLQMTMPAAHTQPAIYISNGTDADVWVNLAYEAGNGSSSSPGVAFGPGGSTAPDVSLFRSTTNTFTVGNAAGGNGSLNVLGTLQQASNQVFSVAGTGLSSSTSTVNSNAVWQTSFQPGLLTSVTNTISAYSKVSKAATVDNMVASALLLTCVTNPTVTFYECGVSTTCSSPTTIATVQVTAAGTATPATLSSAAVTAGDYVGWAISAGTCTSLDISATAQIHSN